MRTTVTAVSAPRSYRLELDDIASVPVRVVRAPQLSLLSWLVDAAAKPSASRTAAALVGVLSAEGRRVLPALGMPGLDRLPDTIVAAGNGVAGSVAEHAERLGDADGSRLAEEVHALWGGRPPQSLINN
jgi:hypothetical protein